MTTSSEHRKSMTNSTGKPVKTDVIGSSPLVRSPLADPLTQLGLNQH
jgi:hypothetical protein